ncbi:hypothetical protein [Nocardiopsis synnemataformans]|uniref:hypothetical protein n=1 Tax=Nocardiopsis synnemataformans TaxID=61305 RepID=UPI003EBBABA2
MTEDLARLLDRFAASAPVAASYALGCLLIAALGALRAQTVADWVPIGLWTLVGLETLRGNYWKSLARERERGGV